MLRIFIIARDFSFLFTLLRSNIAHFHGLKELLVAEEFLQLPHPLHVLIVAESSVVLDSFVIVGNQ
jgi:hypothetical protein